MVLLISDIIVNICADIKCIEAARASCVQFFSALQCPTCRASIDMAAV